MKTHGGKRNGSGRKPLADKKKALTIYPLESQIAACGGDESSKEIALKAVVLKATKKKDK